MEAEDFFLRSSASDTDDVGSSDGRFLSLLMNLKWPPSSIRDCIVFELYDLV